MVAAVKPVPRRLVDGALHAMLDDACRSIVGGFPVGLARIPEPIDPGEPAKFAVLYPAAGLGGLLAARDLEAFLATPEVDVEFEYDVRSHGADREQCQWVADKVREILFERYPWGAPVREIEVEEHPELQEIGRSVTGGAGAPTLVDRQWQATDSFSVAWTRSTSA